MPGVSVVIRQIVFEHFEKFEKIKIGPMSQWKIYSSCLKLMKVAQTRQAYVCNLPHFQQVCSKFPTYSVTFYIQLWNILNDFRELCETSCNFGISSELFGKLKYNLPKRCQIALKCVQLCPSLFQVWASLSMWNLPTKVRSISTTFDTFPYDIGAQILLCISLRTRGLGFTEQKSVCFLTFQKFQRLFHELINQYQACLYLWIHLSLWFQIWSKMPQFRHFLYKCCYIFDLFNSIQFTLFSTQIIWYI